VRLYLDACAIIYAIEGAAAFRLPVLSHIAQAEAASGGMVLTSQLSRLECRVKPLQNQNQNILGLYDRFFTATSVVLHEINVQVIDRATDLRAQHGFRTPDALHLATALEYRADAFLTGDAKLARCPGIQVIVV
jgi:predicted nucleic acid-binding protein